MGNSCYALGGYNRLSHLNQAVYASVDDLLRNTLPANQTSQDDSSDTQSAWNALPNTPTFGPAAAVLVGNLFAIGGNEISTGGPGTTKKEVYMYSSSTNSWIYTSDLPAPRVDATIAELSSSEFMVIGGKVQYTRVSTSYTGTLALYNGTGVH